MLKSKSIFFLKLALFGLLIVIIQDVFDKEFSYHDILVEFHGLVFDLFVFGILITLYESIKTQKENIERYKEEIDDYRFWFSEESMYRIKGLVNRLIKLNVGKINLRHCNVSACPTVKRMTNWDFSGAKLFNCFFFDNDLQNSKFYSSELNDVRFIESDLRNCNFGSSVLNDTCFENCNLHNTNFLNAYVLEKNWLANIYNSGNIGAEELNKKYVISIDTIQIDKSNYYQILSVNSQDRTAKTPDKIAIQIINSENNKSILMMIDSLRKQ